MKKEIIYADIKLNSEEWFAITPNGTEFTFDPSIYNDEHEDVEVVEELTGKTYIVRFHD